MAPFDGTGTQQSQHSGVAPPALPRGSIPPGHQSAPSPILPPQHHHQQGMNAAYAQHSGVHRQPSTNMPMGGQSFVPQSPGTSRQASYGTIPNGSGQLQGASQAYHNMHSPVHQHQGAHRNQMHVAQMHQQSHSHMSNPQHHPQHMGMQSRTAQNSNMNSGALSSTDSRQQQYIPTGLNGNWQSDKDMPHRRDMIQHV